MRWPRADLARAGTRAAGRATGPSARRTTRSGPRATSTAARRRASAERLAVDLAARFLSDGAALERGLGPDFWRSPEKGDLAEAIQRLPPASGPETAFTRRATLEGLWACLRVDPTPAALRTYFGWAATERARRLADATASAARAAGPLVPPHKEVPGGLGRLRGGLALLRTYTRDVRLELRRQQASFAAWTDATGLLHLATGHAGHGGDPLLGWKPGFRTDAVLRDHRAVANAAGQHALDTLWAVAARRGRAAGLSGVPDFALTDPALLEQIDQLLLDQISGIDDTTAAGLRQVLTNGAGGTIADLGQAISDFWDQADLVRGITIAATEMARASAEMERVTYDRNGIDEVEISGGMSGDICDEYVGHVYTTADAEGLLPIHPNCTHYLSPVVPDSWNLPGTESAGGAAAWAGGDVGYLTNLTTGIDATPAALQDLVSSLPGYAGPRTARSHLRVLAKWRAGLRAAQEQQHTGAMVALYLPSAPAEDLAVPGYEPASELHVTLAFLGEAAALSALQVAAVEQAVVATALSTPPLRGRVSGLGRFTNVPAATQQVVWAAVDVPGLDELRVRLVGWLVENGIDPDRSHGFTPHVTLAYVDPGEEPVDDVPPLEFTFDRLTLALAGRLTHYPLGGAAS